jgi:hypothetical protein
MTTKYPNSFYIEYNQNDQWYAISASVGNKSYTEGYLTALDGFYPHPQYRMIGKQGGIVKELKSRAGIHLN